MDTKEKVSIYKAKGKWLTALILFTGTTSIGTISNGTVIGLASEINSASTITKTTDKPASASTSTTETVSSNSENISANKITAPNSTETITASSATSASTYTAQNVTSDSEGISANKITAPNSTETGSDTSSVTGPFLTDKNTYGTIAISSNLAPTVTDETNKLVNSYKQVGNKVYFLGSDGQPITGLRHYGNNKLEYYGSDQVASRILCK
ncbi:hypothetical protein [Lactiplantibacillus plantarum]|uniref:hypothetical protein n=1 Tax=Lactiplantibacillus plantarum TaxID=1590 RepID=UPI00265A8539|nr:hypothetical protein [Lactiplantibacillus plantarum]